MPGEWLLTFTSYLELFFITAVKIHNVWVVATLKWYGCNSACVHYMVAENRRQCDLRVIKKKK